MRSLYRIIPLALALSLYATAEARINVCSLRVNHQINPALIDTERPAFSWVDEASDAKARGVAQQAFQICVATSRSELLRGRNLVWDSDRCPSSESHLVAYDGPRLSSATTYWWRVRVWDNHGRPSSWSEPATFGTGLAADEWRAKWIEAAEDCQSPLFRKEFGVGKQLVEAKAFVTGLGYFEMYVNGRRVGDDCLVPAFTNYTKRSFAGNYAIRLDNNFRAYRVLYMAYDITSLLRQGGNVVGLMLGNGFYRCVYRWVETFGNPCMLCQIRLRYADGTVETIASGTDWLTRPSPITVNGPYTGECYDARLETPRWACAGLGRDGWLPAREPANPPVGRLTPQSAPADKVVERIKPMSLKRLGDGSYEVAFPEEISGWLYLRNLRGRCGDTLNVRYISESPLGIHQYVFRDDRPVSHAPRFTWYVFSRAVISGVDALDASQVEAQAVNTDVAVNAEFSTDNTLVNRLVHMWQRTQLDNMHGCVASDCPHRERSPYTGDGQVACSMVMDNFDAAAFYRKWIRDILDAQNPVTGYVPNGAPWQPGCGGGVAWGAAVCVMPWEHYLYYGDRALLDSCLVPMKMYVDNMRQWLTPSGTMHQRMADHGKRKPNQWLNLGDWTPPFGFIDTEAVHTFYLWLCADRTARAASVLGREADAAEYQERADAARRAFHTRFYDPAAGSYGPYGANILALCMGVPGEVRETVVATVRKEIMDTAGGHINTGFVTARHLFETLADNGLNDVALTIVNKRDYPSFGHWVEQGATTFWEQWDGHNSHNHPMYGGGLTWLYSRLAGLRLDETAPACRHFTVAPVLSDSLRHVSYSRQTPYGRVAVDLSHDTASLRLSVTVPCNCRATVVLPTADAARVAESGRPLAESGLYHHIAAQPCNAAGQLQVTLPQGRYHFTLSPRR